MSMDILNNVNLNKNQLLSAVVENLPSDPSDPVKGQIYFNTTDGVLKIYTGSTWTAMRNLNAVDTIKLINSNTDANNKIDSSQIQGLREALNSVQMSGKDIIRNINEDTGDTKISQDKISGLAESFTNANNTAKQSADNAQSNAINQAKSYTDSEISRLIGGASDQYDTFKEIEDFLKKNQSELDTMQNVARKYSTTIGDGVAVEFTVTHNLNSRDLGVTLRRTEAPYDIVYADVEFTDLNSLKVKTSRALQKNELTVTVIG